MIIDIEDEENVYIECTVSELVDVFSGYGITSFHARKEAMEKRLAERHNLENFKIWKNIKPYLQTNDNFHIWGIFKKALNNFAEGKNEN